MSDLSSAGIFYEPMQLVRGVRQTNSAGHWPIVCFCDCGRRDRRVARHRAFFHFSDTWQLVINTATTIITFLMVFLIQNTQIRDTEAIQLKLDELIRATQGAHNALLDLEELEQETLGAFKAKYQALAQQARRQLLQGDIDTGTPEA